MSIFLNNNYGLKTNIDNKMTEKKPVISGKLANLPEYISALKEGSVFRGEILDIRNNAVKILLGSNDILNARTDGLAQLNIGDILDFKVESNTGMSMLVKAVNASAGKGIEMLMNALKSADIPVNERNLSLVRELVDNGQPIDKQTLKTLVASLNTNQDLNVETAVTMFKHDIPITKENVLQFNNYMEQNNKLITQFNSMTDDIVNTLNEFVRNNPEGDMISFANNILRAITGDDTIDVTQMKLPDNSIENPENFVVKDNLITDADDVVSKQDVVDNKVINEQDIAHTVNEKSDGNVMIKSNENTSNQLTAMEFDINSLKEEIKKIVKDSLLIDKEILNKPEEQIKEELEKYYKDLEGKTDKLLNVLENAGMEKSVLHNTTTNIKANMNFMNDMYNMALYMQLPVKFNESEAHGELYVLNRNRKKKQDNDVLTAFLHLDMENLGATDVSIKLEKDKLYTKFMIEDIVSQDIVEEHLHELKKRLDEKGYMTTLLVEELESKNEESSVTPFEQVLNLTEPKNYIKRYTLDVRA